MTVGASLLSYVANFVNVQDVEAEAPPTSATAAAAALTRQRLV